MHSMLITYWSFPRVGTFCAPPLTRRSLFGVGTFGAVFHCGCFVVRTCVVVVARNALPVVDTRAQWPTQRGHFRLPSSSPAIVTTSVIGVVSMIAISAGAECDVSDPHDPGFTPDPCSDSDSVFSRRIADVITSSLVCDASTRRIMSISPSSTPSSFLQLVRDDVIGLSAAATVPPDSCTPFASSSAFPLSKLYFFREASRSELQYLPTFFFNLSSVAAHTAAGFPPVYIFVFLFLVVFCCLNVNRSTQILHVYRHILQIHS